MPNRRSLLLAGLAAGLCSAVALTAELLPPPTGPAYQIILRSRLAEATPNRTRDTQTGGASTIVEQPEPNTIIVTMGGSAVAGSGCKGTAAGITFNFEQDFDIIPIQARARPPRIGMVGRVIGTLHVTDPGKCGKVCGTAEQAPATASLTLGDANLLSINVKPSFASCGQEVAINHRHGPVEAVAVAGCYRLTAAFGLGVTQGKGIFNRQYAVADFDPAPQLDAFWSDALKPFRAVPRGDFGFKIVVRVVEDAAPAVGPLR
jgi:hypothetical protein